MLIGLNGGKGVGKDTVGSYLVENYGFERLSFAAKLKESAAALFGIDDPGFWDDYKNNEDAHITIRAVDSSKPSSVFKTFTVRQFLQKYGTEAHRDVFGYDFWVDALFNELSYADLMTDSQCITDARFENELQKVHDHGGINIRIDRESVVDGDTHVSEVPPPQRLIDYTVDNNSSFEELYRQIDAVLEDAKTSVPYAKL